MATITTDASAQTIKASVPLLISVVDSGHYLAYCPALELSSYGDSAADARAAFEEALVLLMEDTIQRGTLEKYLLKLGWTLRRTAYEPPYLPVGLLNRQGQIVEQEELLIPA
jgi:predicted RNase H-like HicB family nuclease